MTCAKTKWEVGYENVYIISYDGEMESSYAWFFILILLLKLKIQ